MFFYYRIVLYCIYYVQANLNKIYLNQILYLPTEINQLIKNLHRFIISPLRRRERKSLIVLVWMPSALALAMTSTSA